MNLTLKRFYQAVDLAYPDKVTYYLVLVTDSGREILLPVQKETTEALVEMLYANGAEERDEELIPKPGQDLDEELPPELQKAGSEEQDEESETSLEEDFPPSDDELGEDLEDLEPGNGIYAASPEVMRRAIAAQKAQQTPESEDDVPSL